MPQLNIKVHVCLKIRESVKLQPDSAYWDNGKCPRNGKGSMRSRGGSGGDAIVHDRWMAGAVEEE